MSSSDFPLEPCRPLFHRQLTHALPDTAPRTSLLSISAHSPPQTAVFKLPKLLTDEQWGELEDQTFHYFREREGAYPIRIKLSSSSTTSSPVPSDVGDREDVEEEVVDAETTVEISLSIEWTDESEMKMRELVRGFLLENAAGGLEVQRL
ncbi:hypothetical protein P7C73_g2834, partial [Tremellales sp. Uapishka_1]